MADSRQITCVCVGVWDQVVSGKILQLDRHFTVEMRLISGISTQVGMIPRELSSIVPPR